MGPRTDDRVVVEATSIPNVATISVEVVESEAGLRALRCEWDALFQACERPSPCASHAWVVAWWEAFGDNSAGAGVGTALFVVIVRGEGGALVAAFPLFEERPKNPFRVRRLRNVGFLGREGVYDMTEEPAVLARPDWEARALKALAETLRPHLLRGRWDLGHLHWPGDGSAASLDRAFLRLSPWITAKIGWMTGPHYAELPSTWGEYRKLLTKSMRDNLGYYPRLLTRDGHDWSVRFLREPSEMPEAALRLAELHSSRARNTKGKRHDDHIHGSAQRAFLTDLLERLAAEGHAFVAELLVNREVVASQAFVEFGEELMVYYSGYDEAWYKYSPIFVIDAVVFKDALERGVRRLDFLRVRAKWKRRWGAVEGPSIQRAFVVPLRPMGWARVVIYLVDLFYRRDVVERIPKLRRKLVNALAKRRAPNAP